MKTNEELTFVRKADMQVSDLTSGGYLVAEQMKRFIQVAIKATVASSAVFVTTQANPIQEISKMTTMGRVLQPGVESTALGLSQRSKPGFDKVTLTTKEAVAEAHIPRAALEDQIERGVFQTSVVGYMGLHVRKDLEDMLINGDTVSGTDAWLLYIDGLLASTITNTVAGANATLNKGILRDMITTMPEEFSNQDGLVFWTNRKARSDYRSTISDRVGALGDGVLTGATKMEIGYDDIPLIRVPLFPNTLAPSSNKTNVLLLNPKNAILSFYRQMTVDTEYRPSARVYAIIMTMRIAIAFEHEPMVVKATAIMGQ
jgi:hypothetical protein